MGRVSSAAALGDDNVASVDHPRVRRPGPAVRGGARLRVAEFGCQAVADAEPHALAVTYWFEPASEGDPYPVTVRFTGRRIGVRGKPGSRDRFEARETIASVVPGSGPIAVTTRIRGIAPGRWHVTAAPVRTGQHPSAAFAPARDARTGPGKAAAVGRTAFAPLVSVLAPGARVGAWSGLVGLGALVALGVQAVLALRVGLSPTRVLLLSLVASPVGLAGAKLYYMAGHLAKGDLGRGLNLLTGGMCIQGFVLGAVATLLAGAGVADLPVGLLLDVSAPGLLFGMTVGRFGCFFGGCCAGRATASRWGLWSSDRRLGMRRVPTPLLESAMALTIGLVGLGLVWAPPPRPPGLVFVGVIAAYTLGRQVLFPLRAESRHTAHGRVVVLALAALALLAAIAAAVVMP